MIFRFMSLFKRKAVIILQWYFTSFYIKSLYTRRVFNSKFYTLSKEQEHYPVLYLRKNHPPKNKHKNILFLIHWFELGGAESFALYNMKLTKKAGLRAFAISTVPSLNSEIDKFRSYVEEIIDFTQVSDEPTFRCFITEYIKANDIDIIHIHHSSYMYHALPYIKILCPNVKIIDTTHIVEYENGGFPQLSAYFSKYIDMHHVISKNLISSINQIHELEHHRPIDNDKFYLSYLSSMIDYPLQQSNNQSEKKDIIFYGRFVLQKQPFLFLDIIQHLFQKYPTLTNKAYIYGEGEMIELIKRKIKKINHPNIIFKGRCDDKQTVFNTAKILFIPSLNEGLTLTSYEALAHQTLPVSSDVGAQNELLPDTCLISLQHDFRDKAVYLLHQLLTNTEHYEHAYHACLEKLTTIRTDEFNQDSITHLYMR